MPCNGGWNAARDDGSSNRANPRSHATARDLPGRDHTAFVIVFLVLPLITVFAQALSQGIANAIASLLSYDSAES